MGAGGRSGSIASATFNNRWLTTATGKLGYAWDRVLLYGKAGGAWVGADNPNLTVNGAGQTLSSSTTNNFGWTAGVGVEWAFWGGWSARAEYDFIGLQNQTVTVAGGGPFAGDTININNRNISMFTAGVNYKFGGWGYSPVFQKTVFLGRRAAKPSLSADESRTQTLARIVVQILPHYHPRIFCAKFCLQWCVSSRVVHSPWPSRRGHNERQNP